MLPFTEQRMLVETRWSLIRLNSGPDHALTRY